MIGSTIVETKEGSPSHPLELGHSVVQKLHRSIGVVECRLQSQDHHPQHYQQFGRNHKVSLQISIFPILLRKVTTDQPLSSLDTDLKTHQKKERRQ
jgi:hypothetical protein